MIQELATLYLKALGYESINSVSEEVADGLNVPIFHEVTKANGAPLLWAFLSVAAERDDDILQGYIFEKSDDEDENGASVDIVNDEILAKLFFAGEEAPRFILLFGINQIALIDRNKWNEKRYLQFMMEDIYAFTIEALKAHIFDPKYTKLITKARLRNCAMLQIVDLMSISRPSSAKERRGRISYSDLGINQMGAVYEALLSYRGFIAEEDLYEVKRAGDKFNELDVGYFVKENELVNYDEKTERVRYESGEKKGQLRMYEKGTFIYRLAGREREKSASYYTPEVLTKCLVKYALKELLKDKTADEILHLTVCEPAMGSAAFLNEAINQLAEAYLTKKQEELGETISYDKRFEELQKVKMFIADRNVCLEDSGSSI